MRSIVRSHGVAVLMGVCAMLGCRSKRPTISPAAVVDEGALPPGCAVVARAEFSRLGSLEPVMRKAIAPEVAEGIALTGIDSKDLERVVYCRRSTSAGGGFTAAIAGKIPPNVVELVASRSKSDAVRNEGAGVVSAGRFWIARRPTRSGGGELVIADKREDLNQMLAGSTAPYHLDTTFPLFVSVPGEEVQRRLPHSEAANASPAKAIREMTVAVVPDNAVVLVRLVLGDSSKAQQLSQAYEPIISMLVARMAGGRGPSPQVSITTEEGDVVARIQLPGGALDVLAARLVAGRTGGRLPFMSNP